MKNGSVSCVLGLALMLAFAVMPGCLSPAPPENNTNYTPPPQGNATNQTNVTIIITNPQENTTVEQNQTQPPPPPPVEESKEVNYTYGPNDSLAIYFIYVGDMQEKLHGDAILIKKGDLDVLVDAGPLQSSGRVLDFLQSHNIDDIDVLVSTNADPRHYGGIGPVADAYRVEEFWWSGKAFGDAAYVALGATMASRVKTERNLSRGFSMTLDGVEFLALNPGPKPFADVNNDAIVLRVSDRNFSAVLLSGVQFGAQGDLLNNQRALLKCNVMQAPYYGLGAGTSGIANFLASTRPELMVISGGPDESSVSGGSRDPFRRLLDENDIAYIENYANGGQTVRILYDGESCAYGYLGGAGVNGTC